MIVAKDKNEFIIILQPDNLARMKQGDPVIIPDLHISICYEELPDEKLFKALEGGSRKYLFRGYQDHPDDGQPAVYMGTRPR